MDERAGKPDPPSFKARPEHVEKKKGEEAPPQTGDDLRHIVRNLERSIERALGSSAQVEECLEQVRAQGYEVSLVLEATLAFARRGQLDQQQVEDLAGLSKKARGVFKMSSLDKKFLRSLKIAVDEDSGGGS